MNESVPQSRHLRLPRDSTRQAEGILWGRAGALTHRWSGAVILIFVVIHVAGQALGRAALFSSMYHSLHAPWLMNFEYIPWVRALLFGAVAYHALYGYKLISQDLGWRFDHRLTYRVTAAVALAVFLWELVPYA